MREAAAARLFTSIRWNFNQLPTINPIQPGFDEKANFTRPEYSMVTYPSTINSRRYLTSWIGQETGAFDAIKRLANWMRKKHIFASIIKLSGQNNLFSCTRESNYQIVSSCHGNQTKCSGIQMASGCIATHVHFKKYFSGFWMKGN